MTVFHMSFDVVDIVLENEKYLLELEYKYPFADQEILFLWPEFLADVTTYNQQMKLQFTTCLIKDSRMIKGWSSTPNPYETAKHEHSTKHKGKIAHSKTDFMPVSFERFKKEFYDVPEKRRGFGESFYLYSILVVIGMNHGLFDKKSTQKIKLPSFVRKRKNKK